MLDFLFALCICFVFSHLWIQFSYGLNALEGFHIVIKCPYRTNGVEGTLSWFKVDGSASEVYFQNKEINTLSLSPDVYERLAVSGNHTAGEYNLNISDIRKSDQGIFECSISGTAHYNRQQLVVIGKPSEVKIKNISPDNRLGGTEGKRMLIECTAVGGDLPPDVKLYISEINVANGKQSAKHTLISQRSNDGQTVKCIAGYTESLYYPLTDIAIIYLKLKPLTPTIYPDTVSTTETTPLVVSCISEGSRPAASITWLIGYKGVDLTSHSTQNVAINSTTNTYTITSILTYIFHRSYHKQTINCSVNNIVSTNNEVTSSEFLNITYSPVITVENETFYQSDIVRKITCLAQGNPNTYTYYKWIHVSAYHNKIREIEGSNNGVLTLPSLTEELSYQDVGLYICTASNGIMDQDGKTKQASIGYVKVIASPVIMEKNKSTVFGEIGETVNLNVYAYSQPKYTMVVWYKRGIRISNSAKYSVEEGIMIVNNNFHGSDIQIDGYKISLIIEDIRMQDFTNYKVRLSNGIGKPAEHFLYLVQGGAPKTPTNFTVISVGETTITVSWKSADNGGYHQTFYIENKLLTSPNWIRREIPTMMYGDENHVYELFSLQSATNYNLRIFAANKINKSQPSVILSTQTLKSDFKNGIWNTTGITVFAVGTSCMLLTVISVMVLGLICYWRERKTKTERNKNERTGIPLDNRIEHTENATFMRLQNDQLGNDETTTTSYESLSVKDEPNMYNELNHTSEKSTTAYESIGVKDNPKIDNAVKA